MGERVKPSRGYVLGKPFNELLNWPTDCETYNWLTRQGTTGR